MQIIKQSFENQSSTLIRHLCGTDNFLMLDIETTGLSKENATIYLIGCGYFMDNAYNTIQWFADSIAEEPEILSAFVEYVSKNYTHLVHYNGNRFDIPFLNFKLKKYNHTFSLDALTHIDIYELVKPLKKILALPSISQRNIESFLGYTSDDPFNGRELISFYYDYCKTKSEYTLSALLHHNSEDLLGMVRILPIINYSTLKDEDFQFTKVQINTYTDYNQNEKSELLIHFSHTLTLVTPINTSKNNILLKISPKHTALLRLPIIKDTLKLFYANYKDYYYLPSEDCCIHKSVAACVDKSNRINAKKETCYTKRSGLFIPNISNTINPNFKYDYKSNESYIPYSEDMDTNIFNEFGRKLLNYFF